MFVKQFAFLVTAIMAGRIQAQKFGVGVLGEDESDHDPVFKLGNVTFGGTGCPDGSVHITTATDGKTVSVYFDQYTAYTGERSFDRKSCNLGVPVDVKQGWSVGLFKVDYRGYAYVPPSWSFRKPSAEFRAEYFFAGNRGPKVRKVIGGDGHEHYEDMHISNKVVAGAIVWSPCGASTNFRINTAIMAKGRATEIGIDTTDVTVEDQKHNNMFRYYFTYEQCD